MRIFTVAIALLTACGGSPEPETPAPAPAPAPEPAAEPAPEPEPEPEPAAEEPAAADAPDLTAMSEEDALAWLMEEGEKVYLTGGAQSAACVTCHQANGAGVAGAFPPLAGSMEFMGDCATHAGYVINGLNGEIVVQGVTYNAVMPAQANLTDHEIAAVITYERKSWGNEGSHCMPAEVATVRAASAE